MRGLAHPRRPISDALAAILTSFNRNFKGRNDGNRQTMNFLASPDIVTAMAFSGRLTFNPVTDSLPSATGEPFRFSPPTADDLPSAGFTPGNTSYIPRPSPTPDPSVDIVISPTSTRLELLAPFDPHFSEADIASSAPLEMKNVRCLLRVKGKCTTDEISAAGPWLAYKGAHSSTYSQRVCSCDWCRPPEQHQRKHLDRRSERRNGSHQFGRRLRDLGRVDHS